MFEQNHISFGLCAWMIVGALAGCDAADGERVDGELVAADVAEIADIVAFPPAPTGSSVASQLAPAAPQAIPVAGEHRYVPSGELMIEWLRWANIQPYSSGAVSDPTGDQCGLGQDGPVWFLAGTYGGPVERDCTIAAGKQLFFPLVNSWWVFPSEYYDSDEEIEARLPYIDSWFEQNFSTMCSLTLRLDGEDLIPDMATMHEALYVEVLEPFEIELNEEHWAPQYFAGGVMPSVGGGYYAHMQPLTPGEHTLEFGGTFCGDGGFSTYATYHLHIGG